MIAATRERTKTPAIYKRGDSYAVVYRDGSGQQRQEPARTYDEARRLRTRRAAAVSDGSYQPRTRERFAGFSAPGWSVTGATGAAAAARARGASTGHSASEVRASAVWPGDGDLDDAHAAVERLVGAS